MCACKEIMCAWLVHHVRYANIYTCVHARKIRAHGWYTMYAMQICTHVCMQGNYVRMAGTSCTLCKYVHMCACKEIMCTWFWPTLIMNSKAPSKAQTFVTPLLPHAAPIWSSSLHAHTCLRHNSHTIANTRKHTHIPAQTLSFVTPPLIFCTYSNQMHIQSRAARTLQTTDITSIATRACTQSLITTYSHTHTHKTTYTHKTNAHTSHTHFCYCLPNPPFFCLAGICCKKGQRRKHMPRHPP